MNVAFIPVRGGSKSIPLKNIKEICGQPLVFWVIKAACECTEIDKVYISTDSEDIVNVVKEIRNDILKNFHSKIEIIGRSKESATDTATTEFAMLEFAGKIQFDNIVLIQATSPLLTRNDLERGFLAFYEEGTDSVLSVVEQKRFLWNINENGYAYATNYDIFTRPRRQDFREYYVENGAFYITSRKRLLSSKNRISGNIKTIVMNECSFYEIDEPSDWSIVDAMLRRREERINKNFSQIKLVLTDCDGCLTDGGMYYCENGDEIKKFNTRDGMGVAMLHERGIEVGIITGENVDLVRRRADKLNLDILIMGCKDKLAMIKEICIERGITLQNVVYIGDDINDLDVLKKVGISCCPADAISKVKEVAMYVTRAKGGEGVLREVVELVVEGLD